MTAAVEQTAYLRAAVDRLRAALGDKLMGVVLYGSHARGEAREDSDVDLLVIAHDLPERRRDRSAYLHSLTRGIRGAPNFSMLGKRPEEFEHHFPSLYLDIGLDGVVLHDRDGYTAGKLKRIREIIAQLGLVRMRLDRNNMFWNWDRTVTRPWEITWEGFREIT